MHFKLTSDGFIPIISADDKGQVDCPYCHKVHTHGIKHPNGTFLNGMRSPHCKSIDIPEELEMIHKRLGNYIIHETMRFNDN
jgi:hypothetical protein